MLQTSNSGGTGNWSRYSPDQCSTRPPCHALQLSRTRCSGQM